MAKSLLIMGRRTQGAGCFNSPYSRIVALDADTLEPVMANWQYEGESQIIQGTAFYDHNSVNNLIVSADGYPSVMLNAGNIDFRPGSIITVVNNDKQLKQWGDRVALQEYPIDEDENHDFKKVTSLACSFAVRTDNSLYAWGNVEYGGQLKPDTAERTDILNVMPSNMAGVLLGSNAPYVDQWGMATDGYFTLPEKIAAMDNIVDLVCNDNVRVVLTSDGKVYGWGNPDEGALIPADILALDDITAVYVNAMSLCALRSTGQIVAWGKAEAGGELPDDIAALTDIVRVYPGNTTFVALRANGSIVVWGEEGEYVDFPEDIAALTNIVDVQFCPGGGSPSNYVLLLDDGTVRAFGTDENGILSIPDGLNEVAALTGTSKYCSALKKDGTVVNWGDNSHLDDILVKDKLVNVRAVYGSAYCMAALTADDTLVIWGITDNYEPMTLVPDGVQGNISYMQPYEG
ncbi:TPA_asm: hypothetical protein GND82_003933 [Salmonella enterica subsp. salamae serovar 60:g,m,t:z6]|uniref:Uncharacterized protein n=1 Tax=Salmonella enterica subsp. houtenae serovar 1,40:z4,z32:- TaxID=1967604 RepID=A0A730WDQ7_SALHO|nr:hypothetical protein [Salmonella enterica]HAC6700524.1 hypothetical protein [Salmonella bongori serovar 66:z65:-]HAE2269310.1 hypothetical protein [Salmonella enterica subsp. enterica serovar 1,9,12:-:-]HAE4190773.1 hypothetical protein [Salmonella enterica subsp. houtenae serovar 1,40:z4,z32:-]HAE7515018.1 hypothetical protein [Salmonella enterica subsp. salamae serovar 60:g,m,t:z6]HCM1945681.1 hypothetical protein [Salmonella enterica subsp. salamae serovar 30:g,m,s:e,n,x]